MKKRVGMLILLLVAVIWGSGFVVSDQALLHMSPAQVLFIRFFIAAVLMTAVSFQRFKRLNKKTLAAGIILGLFLYVSFGFQIIGLKHSTPSKNAFLTATNVVLVPFIAFFIDRKKLDIYSLVGALMAVTGIGLISLTDNFTLSLGDLLSLICAFGYAFHIYFIGNFVKKYDYMLLSAVQMITAAILGFFHVLADGTFHLSMEREGWISVLFLGIFCTTIAFFLQILAQKYTTQTTAAIVMSMESVFGTLFSVLILDEKITPYMQAGSILILAAVLISETKPNFKLVLAKV